MKRILLLLLLIVAFQWIQAQTPVVEDGKYNKYHPPKMELRTSAEWEPVQTVVIPFLEPTEKYPVPFWEDMAGLINSTKEIIPVIVLCNDKDFTRADLKKRGMTTENITLIEIFGLRTPWMRDYGPQSAYTALGEHVLLDWIYDQPHREDDESSTYVAYHLDMPVYKMILPPNTLFYSGANLLTDGMGMAVLNTFYRDLQKPKPESEYDKTFKTYFGFKRLIKVDLDFRHLDLFVKLLNEETLLVEDYTKESADKAHLAEPVIQEILKHKTSFGRDFKVVKVPIPEIPGEIYHLDKSPSYVNSLIINSTVLVPIFNIPTDEKALQCYRESMPGYEIVGVPASHIYEKKGTIHCITHEIGLDDPVTILHAALDNQSGNVDGYTVNAKILSRNELEQVTLFWKTKTQQVFTKIKMQTSSTHVWSAKIPKQEFGSSLSYYIEVRTITGRIVNRPLPGADAAWTFQVNSLIQPTSAVIPNIYKEHQLISDSTPVKAERSEKIRMSHIIVRSEPMARELLVRLDNGESFEELAKQYSEDMYSARKGGDAGYFKKGDLLPQLEEIIEKLYEGQVNPDPIKTRLGYHIIKRTS